MLSLITAAIASAVCEFLLPDRAAMKKELRYLFSLVILLILLLPLRGLFSDLPSLTVPDQTASFGEAYGEADAVKRSNQRVANEMKKALCEKFSLSENEIFAVWNNGKLSVRMKKKPGVLPGDIRLFLKNMFGAEAEVKVLE